jgi:hypothetical protein
MLDRSGVKAVSVAMCRILGVIALGVALSGCDRCGDFVPPKFQSQVCKADIPAPK